MNGMGAMRLRVLSICFGLLLNGCATKPVVVTRIKLVRPSVPASLLVCGAMPQVPPIVDQASVAKYIVSLWQSDLQCHAHLSAIRVVLGRRKILARH